MRSQNTKCPKLRRYRSFFIQFRRSLNSLYPFFLFLSLFFFALTVFTGFSHANDLYDRAYEQIETITPRGLEPVPLEYQSRDTFSNYLEKRINRSFKPGELEKLSKVFFLLGLIPEKFSLKKKLKEIYRVQAGAYYDPEKNVIKTLHQELSDSSKFFVYLHELVHAYQDQHFNLSQQQKQLLKKSYDSRLAYTFTIEGHANLLTMLTLMNQKNLNTKYFQSGRQRGIFEMMAKFTSLAPDQFSNMSKLNLSSSIMNQQIKQLQKIPDSIVQQMMDPYLLGELLWYDHFARSSWPEGESWLDSPPSSTRELFFSAKSLPRKNQTNLTSSPEESNQFSNELGVYSLLRWTNTLHQRPDWAKKLVNDRIGIFSHEQDTFVRWRLSFSSPSAARNFWSDFKSKESTTTNQDGKTITLNTDYGQRFVTIRQHRKTLLLFVSDSKQSNIYDQFSFKNSS